MSITPRFQRNARAFATELSSLFQRTIAPHASLHCWFPEPQSAFIEPRARYIELSNGRSIRFFQHLSSDSGGDVRTAEYSYAVVLGQDPRTDWLVRYDYVPLTADDPNYPYPPAHMHVNATSEAYAAVASNRDQPLARIHFPTGQISIEEFIEFLIVEFGARVYGRSREDAITILRESLAQFRARQAR